MKISNHVFYIGAGSKFRKKSMAIANAMAVELVSYGVSVSPQVMDAMSHNKKVDAMEFATGVLKEYTVGKLCRPFFPNWEQRTYFSFQEMTIQVLGYMLQISGNDLEDPTYMAKLLLNVDFKKEKTITLATADEARAKFNELAESRVSLDREQQSYLATLAKAFFADLSTGKRIYSDESRIAVLMPLAKENGLLAALTALKCSPIDALRYAAAKADFKQVKLPSDVLYAQLTWYERIALLTFLNSFPTERLFEDTGMNRGAWARFYKHIHLFSQHDFINRFPTFGLVARVSMGVKEDGIPAKYAGTLKRMVARDIIESTESGNLVYRTFASRVNSAIEAKDFEKISCLMSTNSGYLLRNLGTVANGIKVEDAGKFIALVRSALDTASVDVMFSILGINVNATQRIIDIKGNTVVENASYPKFIADIQGDIKRELRARYGFAGLVSVAEDLKDKVVPFLSKNSELDRGSRIKVDGSKYLYMFVHWIQARNVRTDLDLSVVAFDKDWKHSIVYFGNQANPFIAHSGDYIDAPAPNGATEYIRISMDAIPKGTKYIMPIINVYTGDVFSDNQEVYGGFMFSDESEFSIKRDHVRYDLTAPAQSNIPFLLDVKEKEVMILDFNNRVRNGMSAHAEIDNMKRLICAAIDKTIITMGYVAGILSGDDAEVSLNIKKTAKGANEVEPADLAKLFTKSKKVLDKVV